MPDLLPHFRVIRYDTRGHGASDAPPGDYSIELLARDVLGLAAALGIDKFAFCGLSLGGGIGQWLGARAAHRLTRLVLANTSPRMDAALFETRRKTALENGTAAIVDIGMQRFFSQATLARRDPRANSVRNTVLSTNPAGYAGCCAAIRDMDHTTILRAIRVPTLVIVADDDSTRP